MSNYLELYDYRCRVAAMCRKRSQAYLAGEDAEGVLRHFREARDELFATHPQSALDAEQRTTFHGLRYFPYNPALRFLVDVQADVEQRQHEVVMNERDKMMMAPVGHVHFTVDEEPVDLTLFWLEVYGGGLFLPFRDATCPAQSYGGGRYLFDTIKGSDPLPVPGASYFARIMLDFNYAYNPSCAYNERWTCPLAPVENRLKVAIRAGEMKYVE